MDENQFHGLIKEAEDTLRQAGIDSAAAEVEIILQHIFDVDRIDIYLHGPALLDKAATDKFHRLITRRATRHPLQYILGEMYFYGRRFIVTPAVMVPTPETEVLCDLAINYLRNEGIETPSILDLGTGSGVIAVTMAAELPPAEITALDISDEALKIARKNAALHNVASQIQFFPSDRFAALPLEAQFDLILSNPPYISDEEYKALPPEVLADPPEALVSGPEGLDFIRDLMRDAPRYLKKGGRLMFEIGYNQAEKAAHLCEKEACYKSISIIKDLNEIDRVIILSV